MFTILYSLQQAQGLAEDVLLYSIYSLVAIIIAAMVVMVFYGFILESLILDGWSAMRGLDVDVNDPEGPPGVGHRIYGVVQILLGLLLAVVVISFIAVIAIGLCQI